MAWITLSWWKRKAWRKLDRRPCSGTIPPKVHTHIKRYEKSGKTATSIDLLITYTYTSHMLVCNSLIFEMQTSYIWSVLPPLRTSSDFFSMAAFKSVNLPQKGSDLVHQIVSWTQADVEIYLTEVFILFKLLIFTAKVLVLSIH